MSLYNVCIKTVAYSLKTKKKKNYWSEINIMV